MYCSEAARSVWRNTSPTCGGRPFGSMTAALDGHWRSRSCCFSMLAAISGYIGNPSRASRIAARSDLAEAHRAVALQRRDPGVGRRRHDDAQDAERDLAAVLAHEELGVERARPGAEPGDRHDLALLGVVDHDRRDAGEIDEVDLQDAERDPGRDAGIDRVAAGLQYLEPGGGGEVMPGGDGVRGDGDGRAMGVAHGGCSRDGLSRRA